MIQSVFIGSDAELISRILYLHRAGPDVLDVTYGHGRFWRPERLAGPGTAQRRVVGLDRRLATKDLDPSRRGPQVRSLAAGDFTSLPFAPKAFDVVVCDPPFLCKGSRDAPMKRRYSANRSYADLLLALDKALPEFLRVLRRGGIVLLKIMDLTEGRRRRWAHIDVANLWASRLRLDDVVVKLSPQTMDSPAWTSQQRTRSSHAYFMVFRPARASPVSASASSAIRAKAAVPATPSRVHARGPNRRPMPLRPQPYPAV